MMLGILDIGRPLACGFRNSTNRIKLDSLKYGLRMRLDGTSFRFKLDISVCRNQFSGHKRCVLDGTFVERFESELVLTNEFICR